ncbi:unnamed protein product [Tilletia controversa]|uniref:TATA-binding protein interacting (TIP20) domain-containing protein n=3 Tax=Tilletia TaxID=13289 RepID=A0A8X7MRE9_9BASI|nr:hypothetical protein CF336_g4522 [Tilletia laevis]KAE8196260.1 hypothetical protein CF328_g4188 [Tilletia controversa]KAE8262208.1 hypothetical protein A4X03_0g2635 [Tilletia caries]KAE8201363.1 hypothetical protein CF335_g3758 [Tilletia laevis]KAE8246699.1 hypothetical protein A4X06_0g4914 [Tilletia controversa]
MASLRNNQAVAGLIEKMGSQDPDFRYMALNDVINECRHEPYMPLTEATESQLVNSVLAMVTDTNSEVKNISIKALAALTRRVRDKQVQTMIERLVETINAKEEESRDIASLGLKTLTAEVRADTALPNVFCTRIVPKLLAYVRDANSSQELIIDSLDIISEIISRFPNHFASNANLQVQILQSSLPYLRHSRPAVRKRALAVLGALGPNCASEVFTQLAKDVSDDLDHPSPEVNRTVIQLINTLARTSPRRLGRRLPQFMPRIISKAGIDDDELREVVLQALETIFLRCPAEVTPFVNQIVASSITLLKHDPNYAVDDEDDEDADRMDEDNAADEDGEEDEEDDDELGDDYSDDEDLSWKVRRTAAKVLAAAVTTRSELLLSFSQTIAPALVARFSEREESVRVEILQTFVSLLKQIEFFGGAAQASEMPTSHGVLKRKLQDLNADGDSSVTGQLAALVPSIWKKLSKELVSKSLSTRASAFAVVRELVLVLDGGLDAQVPSLVRQMERTLRTTDVSNGPSASLKGDIVSFIRLLFSTHPPRVFEQHLDSLVPILISSIDDRPHRITIEGLSACAELVRVCRPIQRTAASPRTKSAAYKPYIVNIFDAVSARIAKHGTDQDIRARGIGCVGAILAHAGDEMDDRKEAACGVLLDALGNEVTRLAAVKAITQVAASPVCVGAQFESLVIRSIPEVAQLLRKSNRQLKITSFECLGEILTRAHLDQATIDTVVTEIEPLLSNDAEVSTNVRPQTLRTISLLLNNNPSAVSEIRSRIEPHLLYILQSSLMQGAALDAELQVFAAIVRADASVADEVIADLLRVVEHGKSRRAGTHLYLAVSRCIGAVVQTAPQSAEKVVVKVSADLAKVAKLSDLDVYFDLHTLGELGRFRSFGAGDALVKNVLALYESSSEEVKGAAAFALGNMAVGSLDELLPIIEQHVTADASESGTATSSTRVLSLHALKELIGHASAEQLGPVAARVWAPLFAACETKDEATRNIGAECLARLTLSDPGTYLVQLQAALASPSAAIRAAVITALRFMLTDNSGGSSSASAAGSRGGQSSTNSNSNSNSNGGSTGKLDEALAPLMIPFLSLLKDVDLDVRRHALFALNAAAHNKPQLIRDLLPTVVPLLYAETHPKPELLRKVTMGPFTITTDDGLDLRKNAFETMYTLLDTCSSRLNLFDYMSRVIAGLGDDDGIKVLSSLMLLRLAAIAPVQVAQRLDEIAEPISAALKVKLKDSATKQEVDRAAELQRAIFRVLLALEKLNTTSQIFAQLVKEVRKSDRGAVLEELERHASQDGRLADAMDLA